MREKILRGIEEGLFPGAVVSVARNGDPFFYEAHGKAELVPHERAMAVDMRFDLGALTQVVATMPAVLRTVQMGKLSLADPIARYLPEFATGVDRFTKGQITVFHLLAHLSGLPSWRPLYLTARGTKAYLRALADTPLETAPGDRVIRSDLGYMLLGFALERIWERTLADVCQRLVFLPLEMHQTSFAGEGLPPELCVATEVGNEHERRLCTPHSEVVSFPWRENTVCGEVLDGNAFYGLDGAAGHAGLFSTASDLNRFAELWIRKGIYRRERYLDATLVSLATNGHAARKGSGSGFGWEPGGAEYSIGRDLPPTVFGLCDWNGVSLWCDPFDKVTAVVLTNRVHPRCESDMREWQETFYRSVFSRS